MEQRALSSLPFNNYNWRRLDVYYGNYGQDENIEFSITDAVVIRKYTNVSLWLVLLEALPGGGNDAILQRTALVEVRNDGTYTVHENETILENSGGGGPYDLMIDGLMVTTDGDGVVHVASRGRPIAIDTESFGVGLQAFYDPRI